MKTRIEQLKMIKEIDFKAHDNAIYEMKLELEKFIKLFDEKPFPSEEIFLKNMSLIEVVLEKRRKISDCFSEIGKPDLIDSDWDSIFWEIGDAIKRLKTEEFFELTARTEEGKKLLEPEKQKLRTYMERPKGTNSLVPWEFFLETLKNDDFFVISENIGELRKFFSDALIKSAFEKKDIYLPGEKAYSEEAYSEEAFSAEPEEDEGEKEAQSGIKWPRFFRPYAKVAEEGQRIPSCIKKISKEAEEEENVAELQETSKEEVFEGEKVSEAESVVAAPDSEREEADLTEENDLVEEEVKDEAVEPLEKEELAKESEEDFREYENLILPKEALDLKFTVTNSEKFNKHIGTKEIKNDLNEKVFNPFYFNLMRLCFNNGFFNQEEHLSFKTEAMEKLSRNAEDRLFSKGYIKRIDLGTYGYLCLINPQRREKVLKYVSSRSTGLRRDGIKMTEDLRPSQALTFRSIGKNSNFLVTLSERTSTYLDGDIFGNCYFYHMLLMEKVNFFVFASFFENGKEAKEGCLQLSLEKSVEPDFYLFSGFTLLMAKSLYEKLSENSPLPSEKVIFYGLKEDLFLYLGKELSLEELVLEINILEKEELPEAWEKEKASLPEKEAHVLEKEENEEVEKEERERKEKEERERLEKEKAEREQREREERARREREEKERKEREERERLEKEKEEKEKEVKEKELLENRFGEIKEQLYELILKGREDCALGYLYVLSENPRVKTLHNNLAYALQAPTVNMDYSSEKIFSLYSDENDEFTHYLMIAAAIRNFFLDCTRYDYSLKSLHDTLNGNSLLKKNPALSQFIYQLVDFKDEAKKGLDFYADYRQKDRKKAKEKLRQIQKEAKECYASNVESRDRNYRGIQRFIDMWKMIFGKNSEIATYIQAIIDDDKEYLEMAKDFLAQSFLLSDLTLDEANIDKNKINAYIENKWEEARKTDQFRTSKLHGGLKTNPVKALEKSIDVIVKWVKFHEENVLDEKDEGLKKYLAIKNTLLDNLSEARIHCLKEMEASEHTMDKAGFSVLYKTLNELKSRLEGDYLSIDRKYFFAQFLRSEYLVLDSLYPLHIEEFSELNGKTVAERILLHSEEKLLSFQDKLKWIFDGGGDDYGTAAFILSYLQDKNEVSEFTFEDIKGALVNAQEVSKKRLEKFVGTLELAQSYGKLDDTSDNKKERVLTLAKKQLERAMETKNFGSFCRNLDSYEKKVDEDAKVRGERLLKELEQIKENSSDNGELLKRAEWIEKVIALQNYTVAEDRLKRIFDTEFFIKEEEAKDDLEDFLATYEDNKRVVSDNSKSLISLVPIPHNYLKSTKEGYRLIENWMTNGNPPDEVRLQRFLLALGFKVKDKIKKREGSSKFSEYSVYTEKEQIGEMHFSHPIAGFGSRAMEEGFRVLAILGNYDAEQLIEIFKGAGLNKNTLVLLDAALTLTDRRILARKTKSELKNASFVVIDRVVVKYLFNHYNAQFINRLLFSITVPFANCQPYVWDSSKPIPPEMFIGRKVELEKIEAADGVNIVYGGRQLGKTALLKRAKMNVDHREGLDRAVYIEIKGLNYEEAAKKIGQILYDENVLFEDSPSWNWQELGRKLKKRLQDEEKKIGYLLLLLDEADAFIESCETVNFMPFDVLKEIQGIGMNRFKFVIAGLHNIVRFKKEAALSNNSVLTHLTSLTIKPFEQAEARELLTYPLRYVGFRFPKEKEMLIFNILADSNYFPGLIQLYCAKLVESLRSTGYESYKDASSPPYKVNENHIKTLLSDEEFRKQIREKFEITLKLGEDNLYYMIALIFSFLYYQNASREGYSPFDILKVAKDYNIKKISTFDVSMVEALIGELEELNILRKTPEGYYQFSRYNFSQLLGSAEKVEEEMITYMEDSDEA